VDRRKRTGYDTSFARSAQRLNFRTAWLAPGTCQQVHCTCIAAKTPGVPKSLVVYQDERRAHEDAVQAKTGIADGASRDYAGQNEAAREHTAGRIRY
jgi:hypothetical protein